MEKRKMERFSKVNRQYIPAIMVLIVGVFSAIASYYIVRHIEFLNLKAQFNIDAQNRINAIEREIEINLESLESLKSFYQSSEEVTREEFHEYSSRELLEHPSIKVLQWIPRVPGPEREDYENAAQRQVHPNFRFTELDAHGRIVRAAEREEYFPLYYAAPYETNKGALGFDLASDPIGTKTLNSSRDSGGTIATAQIKLLKEREEKDSILVVTPIYHSQILLEKIEDRRKHLNGFVLGIFKIGDIVESALSYLQLKGIDLHVYDESGTSKGNPLYSHISRMRNDEGHSNVRREKHKNMLSLSQSLSVANRKWIIVAEPIRDYGQPLHEWHAGGLSVSIILITFLMTYYLKNTADKNSRIQNLVKELSDDISERKRIEENLLEAHTRLLTILDGIDSLVYVADMKTYELLFVNKYGRDIWGDIQGDTCWKVLQSGREAPCDFCTNKYLLDSEGQPGEPYTWEFQNTINGDWYYISDRAIRWIDGRLVRLEIASNITERKTLEEERYRSHKLESVGILAGGIAHDFNNLLTAIMNNIYLAKRDIDRANSAYGRLEQAEKAISRANDLTHQFLTFSKGGTPVKHPTSIAEVIRESADFILRGSNVRCEYAVSDNLWPVKADVGQISQVFQNLIINADQSMSEGGTMEVHGENVIVHANSELPLKEGKYVKITIKDQGRGISQEHLQNIFDPYFTTKEMGRGLGLTITFSIIKNHGGYISAESELGRGTTFILYLPASEKKAAPQEAHESTSHVGEGKILIMDDEEMVRSSLGEMIAAIGYEVVLAQEGNEAVKLYEEAMKSAEPFDFVILDLTVPGGMGGKEAIKKLRELDPHIKAIVSSGYSNDPVMANFKEYGFSDIIIKPYNSRELNRILIKESDG
jgi:signal transduction histidine kinase/CHASE1-domain containing sensor protein/ActR/RegA family two-component response regulator